MTERRNSLILVLLAALFGSAAFAPRSNIAAPYTPALSGFEKAGEKSRAAPSHAHTAAGIVRNSFREQLQAQTTKTYQITESGRSIP